MTSNSSSGYHRTSFIYSGRLSPWTKMMNDREAFFIIGIITIVVGLYLMIFVRTTGIDFGGQNIIQISTIFDGALLTIMGIAILIASSKKWDSEK